MTRKLAFALIACVGVTLWTVLLANAALQGFWRSPVAGGNSAVAFATAARDALPETFRGNLILVVLEGGAPMAQVAVGPPGAVPDRNAVFQIASLSKWVTAVGVLVLIDRGLIGLDDPVEDNLIGWRLPESRFDSRGVTVRRLLSHTAGLTDGLGYNGFGDQRDVQTLEASLTHAADAMDGVSGRVEIGARPGSRFAYSGGGYTILQMMVEDVTGQPFARAMHDLLFQPLGMTSSSFEFAAIADELAPIFDASGQPTPHRFYTARAAASLYTTATDLTTFVSATGRPVEEGGLLSTGMLAAMAAPQARILGLPVWGLGATTFVSGPGGTEVIGHDGRNVPAINTAARLHLETGDAIVVLATGTADLASKIADDWVYWRTGRVSTTALGHIAPIVAIAWVIGLFGFGILVFKVRHHASARTQS